MTSEQKKGRKINWSGLLAIAGSIILAIFFREDVTKFIDAFLLLLFRNTESTLYSITIWTALLTTIIFFIVGVVVTKEWPTFSTVLAVDSLPALLCALSYASLMGDVGMMRTVNFYLFIAIFVSVLLWLASHINYSTEEITDFKNGQVVTKTRRTNVGPKS